MEPSLPGLPFDHAALIDERGRPDFRDVFGAYAGRSIDIATAITRVRLSAVDLTELRLSDLEHFRVLVSELNALQLDGEAHAIQADPKKAAEPGQAYQYLGKTVPVERLRERYKDLPEAEEMFPERKPARAKSREAAALEDVFHRTSRRAYQSVVSLEIERPARIRVRAHDRFGEERSFEAEGLEARVIQHEVDHLDGVLILDRASRSDRREAMKTLREALRES